jgi:hypothetical protein
VEKSSQPDARRWEASIRNNLGYALHQLGRHEEALAMQLELDRELQASGRTDVHVLEELEILYRARGDEARAGEVAKRRKIVQGNGQ